MTRVLTVLLLMIANAAAALTFTTHFPTTNSASFVAVTSDPRIVYVLWARALFRSEDGGATFAQRPSYDYIDNLIVDPGSPDILYHWNREEIRRSMDGGVSWKSTDWPRPPWASQLLVDPLHPSTLLLSSRCYTGSDGGLYRSDDRGDHWQIVRSGPCIEDMAVDPVTDEIYTTTFTARPKGGRILPAHVVVADPATPQIRFGIGYDVRVRQRPLPVVVITSDGGKNWQRMQTPGVTGDVRSLALDPISRRLFVATSAGIYVRAEDGGDWARLAAAPEAKASFITLNATTLFVVTDRTVYRAPLPMLDPFTPGGIVAPLAVVGFAVDPNAHVLYAVGSSIWRSRDSGQSWESITSDSGVNYQAIAVDAAGDLYTIVGHWYGIPSEVMRYIPAADEWRKAGQIPYGGYFPSLAAHPTRPGVLFASADVQGEVTAGLYVTTDSGDHWTPVPSIDSSVLSIAVSPKTEDVVHASSYKGMYVSRDAGVSWTKISVLFPSQIVVAPSDPFRVYANYTGMFLRSDDGGVTWTWISSLDVGVMAVDPLDEDSIWVAGFSLSHSTDGGRKWQPEPWNVPGPLYAWRAIIDPDGSRLHIALSADAAYPPYIDLCEWDATLRPAAHD